MSECVMKKNNRGKKSETNKQTHAHTHTHTHTHRESDDGAWDVRIERKRRGEAMLDAHSVAQRGVPPPSSGCQLALILAHPAQCLSLYSGQYDGLFSN